MRKVLPTSEGLPGGKEPVNDRGRVRAIQESVRHGVSSVLLQAVRAGADYGGEVVLVDPLEAASSMGKECVAAQGAKKQAPGSDGIRTMESLVSQAYPHLQKACT